MSEIKYAELIDNASTYIHSLRDSKIPSGNGVQALQCEIEVARAKPADAQTILKLPPSVELGILC
jgi:hypothetical protein